MSFINLHNYADKISQQMMELRLTMHINNLRQNALEGASNPKTQML